MRLSKKLRFSLGSGSRDLWFRSSLVEELDQLGNQTARPYSLPCRTNAIRGVSSIWASFIPLSYHRYPRDPVVLSWKSEGGTAPPRRPLMKPFGSGWGGCPLSLTGRVSRIYPDYLLRGL